MSNVAKNIVYSGSKQNVKLTMIAGRIMYEDGQFLGISPQEVYDQGRRRDGAHDCRIECMTAG